MGVSFHIIGIQITESDANRRLSSITPTVKYEWFTVSNLGDVKTPPHVDLSDQSGVCTKWSWGRGMSFSHRTERDLNQLPVVVSSVQTTRIWRISLI